MSLEDVINLQVSLASSFPSQAGFGVPLLAAYHTATANMVDFYDTLDAVSDDHDVDSPVYDMAKAAFSQDRKPALIAVGRRTHASTMVVTITPLNLVPGFVYNWSFKDHLGVVTPVSYTNPGSPSATTIAAAFATTLASIAGAGAVAATGVLTITSSTPGFLFNVLDLPDLNDLKVKNTSADPGIASDLNAIAAVDATTWYGLSLDSESKAEVLAAAAWTEAVRKIHLYNSSDSEIADNAVTNDVASSLKAAAYSRSAGLFAQSSMRDYRALALMAKMFTTIPGQSTWWFQGLAGITVDKLRSGDKTKIVAKNMGVYLETNQLNRTFGLKMANGEFVDNIVGVDWTYARVSEAWFGTLSIASNAGSKVPYTQDGINLAIAAVTEVLNQGVRNGFLDKTVARVVTFPKLADIPAPDKANRLLSGGTATARVAGAIHKMDLVISLSVV